MVLAAVGSFGGLIYFVYTQGQRAGTEAVAPIIHADPGPTKVKPETPGGMDVPNQDRLIYDRLRADKTDPGVERLLPPPEAPMERPTAPPASQPAPQQAAAAPAQNPPAQTPAAQTPAAQAPSVVPPTVLPPTAAGTSTAKPPAPQQAAQAPAAQVPAGQVSGNVPATNAPTPLVPSPAQTAPQPAPQAVPKPVVAPTPKPVEKPVAPPVPAPATSGGGTIKLQFASIPSEPQAEAEMQRIQRKHAAVLGGLSLRLVKADLGAKGIYYRVQSGPVDEAQAKRICEAVKAAKDGCIPVH
ncbi:SPOR domain-containing protein [Nitrospirillum sp. BR 11828]|uniref:SPOR domain-containing protein n=1 Tax=Nitrospirillum sp. BR 11828 TaxID=3104325 RepID=UPI002ACA11DB|nr:SPOR domain-containing protein [Nitrospirillum sp. BR 11828]MDZ5648480.1 SPOR domain-containing protein [Nitrospirillum sp. BR 11828]